MKPKTYQKASLNTKVLLQQKSLGLNPSSCFYAGLCPAARAPCGFLEKKLKWSLLYFQLVQQRTILSLTFLSGVHSLIKQQSAAVGLLG